MYQEVMKDFEPWYNGLEEEDLADPPEPNNQIRKAAFDQYWASIKRIYMAQVDQKKCQALGSYLDWEVQRTWCTNQSAQMRTSKNELLRKNG